MGPKLSDPTPLGLRFSKALEAYDLGGRLSRGRSYALGGRVFALEVEAGLVRAKVEGRSEPWYQVTIRFPSLEPAKAEALRRLLEEDPFLEARLQGGHLPLGFLESLEGLGIDLIPSSWASLGGTCTCPDRGDPCKHMAAVYYQLAREIERDPRLLFAVAGFELGEGDFAWAVLGRPCQRRGALSSGPWGEYGTPVAEPDPVPKAQTLGAGGWASLAVGLLPPLSPTAALADLGPCLADLYERAARALEGEEGEDPGQGRPEAMVSRARITVAIPRDLASGVRDLGFAPWPRVVVRPAQGRVWVLDLCAASRLFLSFSSPQGSPEYRFLFHFFRHARTLLERQAFVPRTVQEGRLLKLVYRPLPMDKELGAALETLGAYDPGILRVEGRGPARGRGTACVTLLMEAFLSSWVANLGPRTATKEAGPRNLDALLHGRLALDGSLPENRGLPQTLEACLAVYDIDQGSPRLRLVVRESKTLGHGFDLRLYCLVDQASGHCKALSLKKAVGRLGMSLLAGPLALSAYLPELRRLGAEPRVRVGDERLGRFLGEARGLLERLGVEVVLPKALLKVLDPRLVLKVDRRVGQARNLTTYLDIPSVLTYSWQVAIGDTVVSLEEFADLVAAQRPVVRFRDCYVRLDPEAAARLLERATALRRDLEARGEDPGQALWAVKARLSGEGLFSADAEEVIAGLFKKPDLALPGGLRATLRPYQEQGFRWLAANLLSGFGCLLADDMGLGKTIQALALMARFAEDGLLGRGALVVAPAALLLNWEREAKRFVPGLTVRPYHGRGRSLARAANLTLTTFQTLARDIGRIQEREFSLLVVDEAQVLKNAQTKAARAMAKVRATYRMALSGTPVENRLEDLRAILDLVLPGYLGTKAEFSRHWRKPIEEDGNRAKAEELKRITSPFILRRLKTDRQVLADLPEKVEIDEAASLQPAQAALYQGLVERSMEKLNRANQPHERAAIILGLFTSLRQIANHPRAYDKESPPDARLSGKCLLLVTLLGGILEGGEKVLVFSQFVETLRILASAIEAELGEVALLYHGGMGSDERDRAIGAFQAEGGARIMLVSLRAGGLGLNLTAASRVIHYDLWYNPAVETQATDRAFRIGQTKNVFVHRLITLGTFEEKLDAMIKAKKELATMSVAEGENWLTRLSDAELRELFSRGGAAPS